MINLRADFSDKIKNSDYSIFVTFNYNPHYVELIKTLKTKAWNPDKKHWEVPYSEYTPLVSMLNKNSIPYNAQEFLQSIKELSDRVDNMKSVQKQEANVDSSILDTVEFKTSPFNYQKDGIAYGLEHDRFLLADQPGLGKSLESSNIARLKRGGKHCLIIVGYKSLLFNWVKEIETHTDETAYVLGQRMMKRKKKLRTGNLQERNEDLDNLSNISEFFIITDITTIIFFDINFSP